MQGNTLINLATILQQAIAWLMFPLGQAGHVWTDYMEKLWLKQSIVGEDGERTNLLAPSWLPFPTSQFVLWEAYSPKYPGFSNLQ